MDKLVSRKWGNISVADGFFLTFVGFVALMLELQTNSSNYLNYTVFYKFWVPVISFCFIAGSFFVVLGVAYLKKISKWSYVSITAGFALIAVEASKLAVTLQGTHEEFGIGWSDFQHYWSLDFFSVLMAACFLIALGIILGLNMKGKLGYITVVGGSALMLDGVAILAANLATSLNYYPPNYVFSLQVAWNSSISLFITVGAGVIASGTGYLIKTGRRNNRLNSDGDNL